MGGLSANKDNSRGIVCNVLAVDEEVGWLDKLGIAMDGFVLGGLHEDGHE
jgi:hypothetical protein